MRIHSFQHVPFENTGSIELWAQESGHTLSVTHLYANESLPEPAEYDWLVVMGGPMGIYDYDQHPWLKEEKKYLKNVIESGKTVIGICLGAQLIADVLGGKVTRNRHKEIGWFSIRKNPALPSTPLLDLLPNEIEAFHWHGDTFAIPKDALPLYSSEACGNQAFLYRDRVIGFQFHLEATVGSAKKLIENCGDEIVDAPYIQTAGEIVGKPERFDRINRQLSLILDFLEGA